jgi:transcription antitermination factor NusG
MVFGRPCAGLPLSYPRPRSPKTVSYLFHPYPPPNIHAIRPVIEHPRDTPVQSSTATHAPSFSTQPPPAFLVVPLPQFPLPALSSRLPCHALIVRYGQELAAAAQLQKDFDLETICPTFTASWVYRGTLRCLVYPCLRSYLLARWDATDPHLWHALNDLPQVLGFAGGPRPAIIPEHEIEILLAKIADVVITPTDLRRPRPALGSWVRIISGHAAGYIGRVVRPPAPPPVVAVEISSFFSRDIVVEVPISCCEIINNTGHANSQPSWESTRKRNRARRGRRSANA